MATPQTAGQSKQKVLNDLADNQNRLLVSSLNSLEAEILAMINGFTIVNGRIVESADNVQVAIQARSNLVTAFNTEYDKAFALPTVAEYDEAVLGVQKYFTDINKAVDFTNFDVEVVNELKALSFDELVGVGVRTRTQLANTIFTSTIQGREFTELVKDVKGALTGLEDVRGTPMEVHAKTIANDALSRVDRTMTVQKAKDAGLTQYLYFGSTTANTRSICAKEVGKVRPLEEWEEIWATEDWDGKKSSNFIEDAGGWNCNHTPLPVS